jgi:hypothetical protein
MLQTVLLEVAGSLRTFNLHEHFVASSCITWCRGQMHRVKVVHPCLRQGLVTLHSVANRGLPRAGTFFPHFGIQRFLIGGVKPQLRQRFTIPLRLIVLRYVFQSLPLRWLLPADIGCLGAYFKSVEVARWETLPPQILTFTQSDCVALALVILAWSGH